MNSKQIAFDILTDHADCIRDDVMLGELIGDIAQAIDDARKDGEEQGIEQTRTRLAGATQGRT